MSKTSCGHHDTFMDCCGVEGYQCQQCEKIDRLTAVISAMERLARDGHGPVFTQSSVGTSKTFCGIGKTTDDFCAAIVALGRMSE